MRCCLQEHGHHANAYSTEEKILPLLVCPQGEMKSFELLLPLGHDVDSPNLMLVITTLCDFLSAMVMADLEVSTLQFPLY